VVLKKLLQRLTTPVSELDHQRLREFCSERADVTPISELRPRHEAAVVGEITSLRIVPREGSSWLEATMSDGTGSLVVMWTGRRHIAGVAPGKRMVVSGRGAPYGKQGRLRLLNPRYELL
jgi:RecG-like helicase